MRIWKKKTTFLPKRRWWEPRPFVSKNKLQNDNYQIEDISFEVREWICRFFSKFDSSNTWQTRLHLHYLLDAPIRPLGNTAAASRPKVSCRPDASSLVEREGGEDWTSPRKSARAANFTGSHPARARRTRGRESNFTSFFYSTQFFFF